MEAARKKRHCATKTVKKQFYSGYRKISTWPTTEQHFILKGEYKSEGKVYKEGDYQVFSAHENHGPFESKKGALVLVVWDPYQPKN